MSHRPRLLPVFVLLPLPQINAVCRTIRSQIHTQGPDGCVVPLLLLQNAFVILPVVAMVIGHAPLPMPEIVPQISQPATLRVALPIRPALCPDAFGVPLVVPALTRSLLGVPTQPTNATVAVPTFLAR